MLKEIAKKLNGLEYREEIDIDILNTAKENGIVIVIGYSDDGMCFYGAVYDEVGCYNGGKAYFNTNGLMSNKCEDDNCPYFKSQNENATTIEALWCDEPEYSWTYKTTIPHETFDVLEDDEKYCRGIVFSLNDCCWETD